MHHLDTLFSPYNLRDDHAKESFAAGVRNWAQFISDEISDRAPTSVICDLKIILDKAWKMPPGAKGLRKSSELSALYFIPAVQGIRGWDCSVKWVSNATARNDASSFCGQRLHIPPILTIALGGETIQSRQVCPLSFTTISRFRSPPPLKRKPGY